MPADQRTLDLPSAPATPGGPPPREPPDDERLPPGFLDPVDIVRDPLHGDIRLSALERFVIDQPEFQRLRKINQLGLTYVAYPGAVHNRYIHSLGTLHVCTRLIDIANGNATTHTRVARDCPHHPFPCRIGLYASALARLTALTHDMAHVPFGHTLEKEGGVFQSDEWKDPDRVKRIFGPASRFRKCVVEFLGARMAIDETTGARLLDDVRQVLTCDRASVATLPYPFVHDLVGNTICADLLDYVQRDIYFCGLNDRFGDRFISYLAVLPLSRDGQPKRLPLLRDDAPTAFRRERSSPEFRLVLLQYRYNERSEVVTKHDVVAEAIDLVRRRLVVAEKLYYHRTKLSASAMLVAAVADAGLTAVDIWEQTDQQVLDLLAAKSPRAARLAFCLLNRHIYKPLYRISYHAEDDSAASTILWGEHGPYQRLRDPKKRALFIASLEELIALELLEGDLSRSAGTIAVCCPDKDMNLKAFDMLVLPHPERAAKTLEKSVHGPTRKEIEAIQDTHRHLWRLEVYVDPAVVRLDPSHPFTDVLAGAIFGELRMPNEVERFSNVRSRDLNRELERRRVRRALAREGVDMDGLSRKEVKNLHASMRGSADLQEVVQKWLQDHPRDRR